MLKRKTELFKLLGFTVSIDASWGIILFLVIWSLAKGAFPAYYPDLNTQTYWMMGFVGALGLFISIIIHEFSHSLVARKYGLDIKGITLFIFGGVAEMRDEPDNPKTEGDYRYITMEQVKNSTPLPQVPFVVLTAGDRLKGMPPIFSEKANKKMAELGIEMQKKLAAMIPGGKHVIIDDVGHNIHLEKPDALITPVSEMIKEVRNKQIDV